MNLLDRGDMRYIVDTTDLVRMFVTELKVVLHYPPNLTKDQQATMYFLIQQAFQAMIENISDNPTDYLSKIEYMMYLDQLKDLGVLEQNIPIYKSVFTTIAIELLNRVIMLTNPTLLPVEYFPDAVTDTYIVINQQPKGFI
jgi:hypothetical protein